MSDATCPKPCGRRGRSASGAVLARRGFTVWAADGGDEIGTDFDESRDRYAVVTVTT